MELRDLLRLTRLAATIFRVPVSYMALFGPGFNVVKRIGQGMEHCRRLRETWPLTPATAWPILWPDPAEPGYREIEGEGVRFACTAPLYSSDGMTFGLLIIADTEPRPDLTTRERDLFGELAAVFGRKIELQAIAADALAAELSMREAEARFRNIANTAPVLIAYSDSKADCSFVNHTWLEFTGRRFEDEVGHGFAETFHPDFRENVIGAWHDAFAARRPNAVEFPMLRYDGVYRWMHASGSPRFLPDGTFVGYMGCLVDVTEQRAAALEAEKYKAVAAAIAQAGGIAWQLLDPSEDPAEAPAEAPIATHKLQSAGDWTYTPVLVGGKLVTIAATRP